MAPKTVAVVLAPGQLGALVIPRAGSRAVRIESLTWGYQPALAAGSVATLESANTTVPFMALALRGGGVSATEVVRTAVGAGVQASNPTASTLFLAITYAEVTAQ